MNQKKKIKLTAIIAILVIILIMILCAYTDKIKKNKLLKSDVSALNSGSVTTVDITNITPAPESEHEHIYKTHYDDTKHWEECIACSLKRNEIVHNFTTTWALGKESCYKLNSYTNTCKCGYSITGHKPCVWKGKYVGGYSGYAHYKQCATEGGANAIKYSYYLNTYGSGTINLINYTNFPYIYTEFERCYKSNGTLIDSNNLGTCAICGYNYTQKNHYLIADLDKNQIKCEICGKNFGTFENQIIRDSNTPTTYTITTKLYLTNGATFKHVNGMRGIGSSDSVWQTNTQSITSGAIGGVNITLKTVGKLKTTLKKPYENYVMCTLSIGGINNTLMTNLFEVYPDSVSPNISSVNTNLPTTWSRNKTITITGTENWTNTVNVKIENDLGRIVYEGETNVTSNNWSISCTPEIEAGERSRIFTVTVTDACKNSITKTIGISKVDGRPPTVTSSDKVTNSEWAREKTFTFTAEDLGIGNVEIGFNDVNDYSLATKDGNNYSKEYKFVGDAYSPVQASVYYKDGLGNITTQVVTLEKIDNTAPTITNAILNNNVVSITAHDRHSTLGEGSGVEKYRYITSTERLENAEITLDNSHEIGKDEILTIPNINEVKYIYVVAEDAVRKHQRKL